MEVPTRLLLGTGLAAGELSGLLELRIGLESPNEDIPFDPAGGARGLSGSWLPPSRRPPRLGSEFRPMRYSADIVVLDLEATSPEADGNTTERSNIIDIGAVRLDRASLEVLEEFDELVRPTDFGIAPHITELTGITPEMVADRPGFGEVGRRFAGWCGPRNRFVLAVWGAYYDIPLLRRECAAHGIEYRTHFVGGALDIRSLAVAWLAENRHNTTGVTVARVLDKMAIAREFRFHRALDDARAEARILQRFHQYREVREEPPPS